MMMITTLIVSLAMMTLVANVDGYRPVVFMHGLFTGANHSKDIFEWIEKYHPGTETWSIPMFERKDSLINLWTQVEKVGHSLQDYMNKHPQGIHLIGFSQGGIVCRGILQALKHNVHTFISLASPQAGVFGVFGPFEFLDRDDLYKLAYSKFGQGISVLNVWNDPHHQDLYKNSSVFLALLNNQTYNNNSADGKANFIRLKKLVTVGGPDDALLVPWQSSLFGFYDKNLRVEDMRNQSFYTNDWFGLRTLDKRGSLIQHQVPGVSHHNWRRNETVFKRYILPYLD